MRLKFLRTLPLLVLDHSFEEFEKVVSDSEIPHDFRCNTFIRNNDEVRTVSRAAWINFINEESYYQVDWCYLKRNIRCSHIFTSK